MSPNDHRSSPPNVEPAFEAGLSNRKAKRLSGILGLLLLGFAVIFALVIVWFAFR